MNADYPILQTDRLVLRKFNREEAMIVRELAGNPEVAHGCINIPHPYGIGIAEIWIACHETWYAEGSQLIFAITRKTDQWIIGTVGLTIDSEHVRADIGYWIGVPFWNYGYATEAARAVISYGFGTMGLHKITASHFLRNHASGRVLEKLDMHKEGLLRNHLQKGGVFEDVVVRGILIKEWKSQTHTRNNPPESDI